MAENNKTNDAFLENLQDKLISGATAVSSADSGIEKAIQGAITSTETGRASEETRIRSEFNRARSGAFDETEFQLQGMSEARGGFATQQAGFRRLFETSDKFIADLESRKQEALATNNTQAAFQIQALQIQSMQAQGEALQNSFNNLLAVGSFGLQQSSEDRAGREFNASLKLQKRRLDLEEDSFIRKNKDSIAALASKYGVLIDEGDSLEQIANKISPIVTKMRGLEEKKLVAEINKFNKGLQKDKARADLESRVVELMTTKGMTASQAALQAIGDMSAVGLNPTTEDLNFAVDAAEKNEKIISEKTNQIVTENAPGYWEMVFGGLSEDSSGGPSSLSTVPARAFTLPAKGWEAWKGAVGF